MKAKVKKTITAFGVAVPYNDVCCGSRGISGKRGKRGGG